MTFLLLKNKLQLKMEDLIIVSEKQINIQFDDF